MSITPYTLASIPSITDIVSGSYKISFIRICDQSVDVLVLDLPNESTVNIRNVSGISLDAIQKMTDRDLINYLKKWDVSVVKSRGFFCCCEYCDLSFSEKVKGLAQSTFSSGSGSSWSSLAVSGRDLDCGLLFDERISESQQKLNMDIESKTAEMLQQVRLARAHI